MTAVSNLGNGTIAINTGDRVVTIFDADHNGQVNTGDVVVDASQAAVAVRSMVIGSGQATNVWGDPHINDVTFTKDAEATLVASLDKLYQDAKDGKIDDSGAMSNWDASLNAGQQKYVGDFHADCTIQLIDGKSKIDYDVVKSGWQIDGNDMYVADHVDIQVGGQTVTIREVWGDNGGAGQMSVSDTTSNPGSRAVSAPANLPVIHEMDGANVRVGVTQFGEGTTGSAAIASSESFILDAGGNVRLENGQVTMSAITAFDYLDRYGSGAAWLSAALSLREPPRTETEKAAENDPRKRK